jgi:hypothetical protein
MCEFSRRISEFMLTSWILALKSYGVEIPPAFPELTSFECSVCERDFFSSTELLKHCTGTEQNVVAHKKLAHQVAVQRELCSSNQHNVLTNR